MFTKNQKVLTTLQRYTAFTLAEILLTLGIIGVVAAMTISSLITNINDSVQVASAKKIYSTLANATALWQVDESCVGDVSLCLDRYVALDTKNAFKGIEKYIGVNEKFCGIDGSPEDINWLPEQTTLLNGWKQKFAFEGVSKLSNYSPGNCYYLLNNGATLLVEFPDDYKKSGFALFDTNGKKPPNRIGKDTFPVGWGASGNIGNLAKNFHPYWAEDQWVIPVTKPDGTTCTEDDWLNDVPGCASEWHNGPDYKGLCRISCYGCSCQADVHSPTAYVIQYGKLPDLKAAGYPE